LKNPIEHVKITKNSNKFGWQLKKQGLMDFLLTSQFFQLPYIFWLSLK
jgi:hypothetical protein